MSTLPTMIIDLATNCTTKVGLSYKNYVDLIKLMMYALLQSNIKIVGQYLPSLLIHSDWYMFLIKATICEFVVMVYRDRDPLLFWWEQERFYLKSELFDVDRMTQIKYTLISLNFKRKYYKKIYHRSEPFNLYRTIQMRNRTFPVHVRTGEEPCYVYSLYLTIIYITDHSLLIPI